MDKDKSCERLGKREHLSEGAAKRGFKHRMWAASCATGADSCEENDFADFRAARQDRPPMTNRNMPCPQQKCGPLYGRFANDLAFSLPLQADTWSSCRQASPAAHRAPPLWKHPLRAPKPAAGVGCGVHAVMPPRILSSKRAQNSLGVPKSVCTSLSRTMLAPKPPLCLDLRHDTAAAGTPATANAGAAIHCKDSE